MSDDVQRFELVTDEAGQEWLLLGNRQALPTAPGARRSSDFVGIEVTMHSRGCVLEFETGLSLSIIWGTATYSSNYLTPFQLVARIEEFIECPTTVEVGVLRGGELLGVLGYQTVDDVLRVVDACNRGEVPVVEFEFES